MSYRSKADVVITPATWKQRVNTLTKTPTDLYNIVGWYGSTHTEAMWRKTHTFIDVFQGMDVIGFDPQLDDWDPVFARIEAEVLANASVTVIRLENNELLNGSLGSIAEIGMALASAALRGQVVIVSIEDGLLTTLSEPGAIAQYMLIELSLEHLQTMAELTPFLRLHHGDDLQELAILACKTAKKQMETAATGLDFNEFLAKKARREQNYPLRIVVGGSGGAYADKHIAAFKQKKEILTFNYLKDKQVVKILSEGAIAEAWNIPYGSIDHIGVAMATRTLWAIETEAKREADILLIPIMTEAASKGASTEIGLLLLYALTTGQDVKIYMEPFNPLDYITHQFDDVDIQQCEGEKDIRKILQKAGVANAILAVATQEEVAEAFDIFKALKENNAATYRQVKRSLLGKTEVFQNADNIRRVRALVQAHLERLKNDKRFPGFFSYLTRIGESIPSPR